MPKTQLITSLAALCLISSLVSCSLPSSQGGPQAWIDAPLTGTVLPVNQPATIKSHSSAASGIAKVELDVNRSVVSTDVVPGGDQTYLLMDQSWTPTQAGTYQVRVRAQTSNGQWSRYAVVTVTVVDRPIVAPSSTESPTAVFTFTPTLTETPASTSTPAATSTPTTPRFTLTENAFCRKGADVSFPDVTGITTGETVDIMGVSEDGFWYFVFWKRFGVRCWVAAPAGQVSGDLNAVPMMVSPPTSTPVPVRSP